MAGGFQHSDHDNQANKAIDRITAERVHIARPMLQSWKEIASDLRCGVRTAQRWEQELGLPVRRLGKGSRAPVLVFKDELNRWLENNAKVHREQRVHSLQSIGDFLARGLSSAHQMCGQCHSPMRFLKGHLWVYGRSRKWNLSVPFCPLCDGDLLERLCRDQIVQ